MIGVIGGPKAAEADTSTRTAYAPPKIICTLPHSELLGFYANILHR